jgi:hypothetical protein
MGGVRSTQYRNIRSRTRRGYDGSKGDVRPPIYSPRSGLSSSRSRGLVISGPDRQEVEFVRDLRVGYGTTY